ncbi:hypothetical protein MMC06_003842 [Schaereria dolodes]|nr:hypothetical protein [Schaereria dolodes]
MATDATFRSLLETTFTVRRLSPLHHAFSTPLLSVPNLKIHALRFGDILKGEVLRGIHVGPGNRNEGLIKLGTLHDCQWIPFWLDLHSTSTSNTSHEINQAEEDGRPTYSGIRVTLEYEKGTYTAILLRNSISIDTRDSEETHLPLLFIRMSTALQESLLEYLAVAFDTRTGAMQLSSRFICTALERLLENASDGGEEQLKEAAKDVRVTLGFTLPVALCLKTIDITIRKEDLIGFLTRGRKVSQFNRDDPNRSILKEKRRDDPDDVESPFMTALSIYLRDHLGLDINHKSVRILKIVCGAFVLSGEGKVKMFSSLTTSNTMGSSRIQRHSEVQAVTSLINQLLVGATSNLNGMSLPGNNLST